MAYFSLDRYKYIKSKIPISESQFLEALEDLENRFKNPLAKDLISLEKAMSLKRRANKQEYPLDNNKAIAIANKIIEHNLNPLLVNNAKNIISEISSKELSVQVNPYQRPNKNFPIFISYNNLDSLKLKIYSISTADFEFLDKKNFYSEEQRKKRQNLLKKLSSGEAEYSNSIKLPNKKQHLKRTTVTIAPQLEIGKYAILLLDKNLDHLYALQPTQVSQLSLISSQDDNISLKVVHRETGKPIANAMVKATFSSHNKTDSYEETSDKNGDLSFPSISDRLRNIKYHIKKDKDEIVLNDRYSYYQKNDEPDNTERGFLFTDRSIYRPGQTIYFKGILVSKKNNVTQVIASKKIWINFLDANGNEIEKKTGQNQQFRQCFWKFRNSNRLKNRTIYNST